MTLDALWIYVVTVFVATIIPGPSMLLALTHGMNHGPVRTLASAMGNLAVTLVQAMVSIAGLGAVLMASETLFQGIKWAGAAYLIYVGAGLIRRSPIGPLERGHKQGEATPSLGHMFMEAACITAGNPKAVVFFTAVFPQFINHTLPLAPQCGILLSMCSFIAFGCFMLYAMCGHHIVQVLCHESVTRYVNKVVGGTFIGAGVGLAVSRN